MTPFGRRKASSRKQLLQILQAFYEADTWAGSRIVIEENPELLSDQAETLLAREISAARGRDEGDLARYLEKHLDILRQARQEGLAQAFSEERLLEGSPVKKDELAGHAVYRLGRQVMGPHLSLDQALAKARSPATLLHLDQEDVERLDDYSSGLLGDWRRAQEARVMAELNHAVAEALGVSPRVRAAVATTLAHALGALAPEDEAQRTALLERRIDLYRVALQIGAFVAGGTQQAGIWRSLGETLMDRFRATQRASDLDQAVEAFERAFSLAGEGPAIAAVSRRSLGAALLARFEAAGNVSDLDRAIDALEEVAAGPAEGSAPSLRGRVDLGRALLRRFERQHEPADLDRAIHVLREALRVIPDGSDGWVRGQVTLGRALHTRYETTGGAPDLDAAIAAYGSILSILPAEDFADYAWLAALPLGELSFRRGGDGDLARAARAYAAARTSADAIYFASLHETGRQPAAARKLAACHAYSLARVGDLAAAVEALEAGRARMVAEIVLGEGALDRVGDPAWRDAFVASRRQVEQTWNEYRQAGESARSWAQARLSQAQRNFDFACRALFGEFFDHPSASEVSALAARVPLVYTIVTSAGGLALIVYDGGITPVWCDITEGDVDAMLVGPARGGAATGILPAQRAGRAQFAEALGGGLALLGEKLMGPLAGELRQLFSAPAEARDGGPLPVVLVPVGPLALLPLHASTYGPSDAAAEGLPRSFLDEFAVSYVPSARLLGEARRAAEERADAPPRLVGVGDPGRASPAAQVELEAVAGLYPQEDADILRGAEVTRDALLDALARATVAHVGSSWCYDPETPRDAAVSLAGEGRLALRDLMEPEAAGALPRLRLIVLSDTRTALDLGALPGDLLDLPAGLLQWGIPTVVANLWPVKGPAAVLLMLRFHELLLAERWAPAAALRSAQLWLRDLTCAESLDSLERHGLAGRAWGDEAEAVARLRRALEEGRGHERPFVSPHDWAGFACHGAW